VTLSKARLPPAWEEGRMGTDAAARPAGPVYATGDLGATPPALGELRHRRDPELPRAAPSFVQQAVGADGVATPRSARHRNPQHNGKALLRHDVAVGAVSLGRKEM
jgi:hypothetical protein